MTPQAVHQIGGRQHDNCEAAVQARANSYTHVQVSAHRSEAALLAAVAEFAATRLQGADVLLVAYNGEVWRGGFDLSFLRTRFASQDAAWPFQDVPYADLLPVVRDLFNTTVDGEETADLETAYDVLCDGAYDELDPFDESSAAVTAYDAGQYTDLVLHNVADVLRTRALGRLAEQYCSKSDFDLKSLTPVIDD